MTARVGKTVWTTSLFPRSDGYAVPIKASVRQAEGLTLGATVHLTLTLDVAL